MPQTPPPSGRVLFGPGAGGGGAAPPPPAPGGGGRVLFGPGISGSSSAPAAPAAPQASKPGFLSRVVSDVKQGVGGVIHLPGALLTDRQTLEETVLGKRGAQLANFAFLGPAHGVLEGKSNAGIKQNPGESLSAFTARKYPMLGGALVQGPVNLGEHVMHPTQAIRDYSAHPVLGPVSDLATLAMVTGPAAGALKAGAEGAAEGATAASAAGDAAQAAKMASRAATLGKAARVAEGVHGVVEAGASGGIRPLLNGVGPLPGLRAIPEAAFKAVQEGGGGPITRSVALLAHPMHALSSTILGGKAAEKVGEVGQQGLGVKLLKILPDPEDQRAAMAVGEKAGQALSSVRSSVGPEQFAKYVEDRYKGTLSPKAANLVADTFEGKNPEFAAKADEFLKTASEAKGGQAQRTAAFLAKPGNEWQGGYAPSEVGVRTAVDEASKGLPKAERLAGTARLRADRAAAAASDVAAQMRARVLGNVADSAEARVGKITAAADRAKINAEYDLTNAPSRLRPVLSENRAAAKVMLGTINDLRGRGLPDAAKNVEDALAKLPTDLKGLQAAGIDAPHFFHTQEIRGIKGGRSDLSLPRLFKAGSEKLRTGSPAYDRTVAGQVKGGIEAVRAEVRRATVDKINSLPGITTELGKGPLADARTAEDAAKAGFVPWNPSMIFDTQGKVRSLSELDAQLGITGTTKFIPAPLFDQFRNYFEPRRGQLLGAALDPLNRVKVISSLALSPAFIVGRIFGHGMLALSGTSDPIAFAHNLIDVIRQYRASGAPGERSFEDISPPRLLKSNATTAEYNRLVGDTEGGGGRAANTRLGQAVTGVSNKLSGIGNAVIAKPFTLASFFDDMQRTAFYLTEKSKVGPERALEATLRATGEFDRMTPFERDYVRRIIPFWAWHRELTRVAFHLAEDHPLRVAWTLHLANMASQPDTSLPDQYSQGVKVGGNTADVRYLNPFNEVGNTFGGGALGIGKIAGPGARLIYSNALAPGRNASTGRDYTSAASFGQPAHSPSIARQILQPTPQKRLLDTLTGADRVKRYDSGQVKKDKTTGKPVPALPMPSPLRSLLGFAGVPVANTAELEKQKAIADAAKAKAQTNAATQKANYAKAGKGKG